MSRYDKRAANRVRTPVEAINLAGCGGIAMGGLVEPWGQPRAGKSVFAYQCAQYLLEDYGDEAVIGILPAEGAVNKVRLKRTFGLDVDKDDRIWVAPAFTIEAGNKVLTEWCNDVAEQRKIALFIWDTISASTIDLAYDAIQASVKEDATKKEQDGGSRNSNLPMATAAVLKWMLKNMLALTYEKPTLIMFINQVTSKANQFSVTEDSGGGWALRHNVNERYQFTYKGKTGGENSDEDNKKRKFDIFTGTESFVSISKSRFIPIMKNIPLFIDDTVGGKFIPEQELVALGINSGIVTQKSGGWYNVNGGKNVTRADLAADPALLQQIRDAFVAKLRSDFSSVDWEYKEFEETGVLPKAGVKPAKGKKK